MQALRIEPGQFLQKLVIVVRCIVGTLNASRRNNWNIELLRIAAADIELDHLVGMLVAQVGMVADSGRAYSKGRTDEGRKAIRRFCQLDPAVLCIPGVSLAAQTPWPHQVEVRFESHKDPHGARRLYVQQNDKTRLSPRSKQNLVHGEHFGGVLQLNHLGEDSNTGQEFPPRIDPW